MVHATAAQLIGSVHPLTGDDKHLAQIRIRGAQATPVMHRHRENAGNRAGKGHLSPIGGAYRLSDRCGEVNAPVASVAADRRIGTKDLAYYG
jgi:hypothetical protein